MARESAADVGTWDDQAASSTRDDNGLATATKRQNTTVSSASNHRSSGRIPVRCRFFSSKKGCRAGDACPYLHIPASERAHVPNEHGTTPRFQQKSPANDNVHSQTPTQDVASEVGNLTIADSRPVSVPTAAQRPVSEVESQNPREFQINQLRRRFRPNEQMDGSKTTLSFSMVPSDPDFPYELEKLQCILHVPLAFPAKGRPKLKVTNPEMDTLYQENVERGFDDIVDVSLRNNGRGTLLGWMNGLDRQLERILSVTERGPMLKFVANVDDKPSTAIESASTEKLPVQAPKVSAKQDAPPPPIPEQLSAPPDPRPMYTSQERSQAEKRRRDETKQLEARLGRLPLFQKSSDGFSYTVPVQPSKLDRLPIPLRSVKAARLTVPLLYPLECSSIELQVVDKMAARPVEAAFLQWTKENPNLSLTSQVNYLASNMHVFAKKPLLEESIHSASPQQTPLSSNIKDKPTPQPQPQPPPQPAEQEQQTDEKGDDDRSHIRFIPRPPEWNAPDAASNSNSENDESTDLSTSEDEEKPPAEEDKSGEASVPVPDISEGNAVGRGVALIFPFLELYGIELLELVNVYVTIRCERCKESMDVQNIRQPSKGGGDGDGKEGYYYSPGIERCKKCTNPMSIGFRRQLIHQNSNRAGYLDLDGCTVVDFLPSLFIPTCAECSTPFPAPGVSAVRGESALSICRECHRRMVFKIPEVNFQRVGYATVTSRGAVPLQRKKQKETLGIVAGQELPRRGRCRHYGKSCRWFRFSCCAKVFPCDKCHDAASDHPNEHANRMICGFCSREQIYRPENCGICHALLIGKAGSGFWEGGKGTRNRVLMSRKDPRKFKRQPGTKPGGSSSSKRR